MNRAPILPWIKKCAQHIDDAYAVAIQQQCVGTDPPIIEVAYIIAAHEPKQDALLQQLQDERAALRKVAKMALNYILSNNPSHSYGLSTIDAIEAALQFTSEGSKKV